MNEAAANVLYAAERKGIEQAFGGFTKGWARCALHVLGFTRMFRSEFVAKWGFIDSEILECCDCRFSEPGMVMHLNDKHHLTFSEIARKLGPDSA